MAQDELDKSEDATPFKLDEARKKGQVARSMEFPGAIGLLVTVSSLILLMGGVGVYLTKIISHWISHSYEIASDNSILAISFSHLLSAFAGSYLKIISLGVIITIAASVAHTGPVLSFFPLKPNFGKLNPAEGLKKLFSRKSFVDLIKLLIKLGLFALVGWITLTLTFNLFLNANQVSISYLMSVWGESFRVLTIGMLAVILLTAFFDLWFSKKEFARQMRMSKSEVKQEYKKREGDPEVKKKRKKDLSELLTKVTSLQKVGDADVIVTNPTHYAVALRYRSKSMALPVVVSKGKGSFAKLIRQSARKKNIPIVRQPLLARTLYSESKIGSPISLEAQRDVAAVYKELLKAGTAKIHD